MVTLITLLAMTGFIRLGFWQLDRMNEKRFLAGIIADRMSQKAFLIKQDNIKLLRETDLEYQRIEIKGHYEMENQFFLDNKKYQGKIGFHLIVPFRIKSTQQYLLVNRGWVPMGHSRQDLPKVETPRGLITLFGRIQKSDKQRFRPGVLKPSEGIGGIWLYIDTKYFSDLTSYDLLPLVLLLDKNDEHGFVREWPAFKANTEMHMGYAFQWFVFALLSLVIYLSFAIKTIQTHH